MQSFLNKIRHNQSAQKTDLRIVEMHSAAAAGKTDVVEALLRIGVDVEVPISMGNPNVKLSPLLIAVENNQSEVVRILIRHKANLEGIKGGNVAYTPFQLAQDKGYFKTFAAMLDECTKQNIKLPEFDPVYIIGQAHGNFVDLREYINVLLPAQKTLAVEAMLTVTFKHDNLAQNRELLLSLLENSKVTTNGLTLHSSDDPSQASAYASLKKLGELLEAGTSPAQALEQAIEMAKNNKQTIASSSPKP